MDIVNVLLITFCALAENTTRGFARGAGLRLVHIILQIPVTKHYQEHVDGPVEGTALLQAGTVVQTNDEIRRKRGKKTCELLGHNEGK